MIRIFRPFRFVLLARHLPRDGRFSVLDVGCGNHSPAMTKKYFPSCIYTGLDREEYVNHDGDSNDERDRQLMTGYIEVDLEDAAALHTRVTAKYDVIVISHTLEHIRGWRGVVDVLSERLNPGGFLYIEFPRARSLSLPPVEGTLNFCDDDTHVYVHSARELSNILLTKGMRIMRAGVARHWLKIILLPIHLPLKYFMRGFRIRSSDLWDVTGFAGYVLAKKLPARSAVSGSSQN